MSRSPADAGLGLAFSDHELEARIRGRLAEVEAVLRDSAVSEADFITEAAQHVMAAGGKRFRPLLTLLASEFGPEPDNPDVVRAGALVELTHLATLYHDDVMDEAALRRGADTANARWDNSVAILTGDWLFARASDLVAGLGPEAVRIQARTFGRLVEGQIRETIGVRPGDDALAHYLSVVEDKTGSLIATSTLFGAMFAGADPGVQETLRAYGDVVGQAFQLADDILDVVSESGQSGKTPGTDLREGVPTLPVLIAQRSTDPSDARLHELLGSDLSSDDELVAETLTLLRAHPAIAEAEADVRGRVEKARALLTGLPDIPARAALDALCDMVVSRDA